jgi:predicted outer membrane repeat protein
MKQKLLSVILISVLLLGPVSGGQALKPVHAAGTTCYVDLTATAGANNGSTWPDAYTDLQPALAAGGCDEIHVASGTYYPATARDPMASFVLLNNVAIMGGYPNSGGDVPDPAAYPTTLDGNSDRINPPDSNYYSYHVVIGDGTDASAVLDGFTITNGNAASDGSMFGGGMTITSGSPTLRNLVLTGNTTNGGGGGIYLFDSSPTLTDITFTNNGGSHGGFVNGGGLWSDGESSPVLLRVKFDSNYADYGGGMFASIGNPSLTEVTFLNNQALTSDGGGLYIDAANLSLKDSHFDGNTATYPGHAEHTD